MNNGFEECDSCGNYIEVDLRTQTPRCYQFGLQTGKEEWREYIFILCTECKRKIVDWIDDCDESEVHVELHTLEDAVEALREHAEVVEDTAEELERTDSES